LKENEHAVKNTWGFLKQRFEWRHTKRNGFNGCHLLGSGARVVGATGLDDSGHHALSVDLVESLGVEFNGEVADDVLDISTVDGHLCTTEGLDLAADPSDEGELGAGGLLITSVDTDVSIAALILREVLLDGLKGIALTLGLHNNNIAGVALVAEDDPGGLRVVIDNVVVSLNDFRVLNVCHG